MARPQYTVTDDGWILYCLWMDRWMDGWMDGCEGLLLASLLHYNIMMHLLITYVTTHIITITRGILQRGRSAAGGHPRSLPGLSASVITATAVSASLTHSQRSLCHLSDTGGVPRQERLRVRLRLRPVSPPRGRGIYMWRGDRAHRESGGSRVEMR